MEKQTPKYFELVLLCQESEKRVFYRLYVELTDLDRKLWRGGKSLGELEMMKHRTGILSALPENVTPIGEAMGRLIESGRLEVFADYKDGRPVHELRVPDDTHTVSNP